MIKKIAGVFRAISGSPHPKNFTSAVIAAAGSSVRFGGDTTKQFTELRGVPMIVHTLRAFEACDCIHEIIIVAKKNEIAEYDWICKKYHFEKVSAVIAGGYTRQDSVRRGLDAVSKKSKYIAIADGARCLITPEQITSVCHAAYKYGAATAAHRATDTVKLSDKKGFIDTTIDRNTVWLAQTPQVFKTKLYRAAAYTALKKKFEATDDNMLVEYIKHPIRLVECGSSNLKVTTIEDMVIATEVLQKRLGASGGDET